MIIKNIGSLKLTHALSTKYFVDSDMMVFYWKNFASYPVRPDDEGDAVVAISEHIELEPTGVWYFVLTQCSSNETEHVTGTLEWKNPFGYLSGSSFANLPVYLVLVSAYFGIFLVWSGFSWYFKKDLMGLQHIITVTIFVAFLETLLWASYFTYFNYDGNNLLGANWVGALLGALKVTSLKSLLLLVSIGYSITRPTLTSRLIISTSILTAVYFLTEAANEYIFVGKYMGLPIPDIVEYLANAALVAFNLIYAIWIAYALNTNMIFLRQKNQLEKLSLYKIFASALLVFLTLSTLCFILQVSFSVAKFHENMWAFWWIWNAYWQLSYLALTLLVAFLWRPNANNLRYAFSTQIPAKVEKMKDKSGDELSGDVQLKGDAGGDTSDDADPSDDAEGYTSDALENLVL